MPFCLSEENNGMDITNGNAHFDILFFERSHKYIGMKNGQHYTPQCAFFLKDIYPSNMNLNIKMT